MRDRTEVIRRGPRHTVAPGDGVVAPDDVTGWMALLLEVDEVPPAEAADVA